jgi:hypothetical protein
VSDVTSIPIGDVNTVDVVGVRKDGGLDMVISVTGPIDGSPLTLVKLETKIRNYIKGATSEAFLGQYGRRVGVPVTILISCVHHITEPARDLIEKLRAAAAEYGIRVELQTDEGDV